MTLTKAQLAFIDEQLVTKQDTLNGYGQGFVFDTRTIQPQADAAIGQAVRMALLLQESNDSSYITINTKDSITIIHKELGSFHAVLFPKGEFRQDEHIETLKELALYICERVIGNEGHKQYGKQGVLVWMNG